MSRVRPLGWCFGAVILMAACGAPGLVGSVLTATHRPPSVPIGLHVSTTTGRPLAPDAWTNQSRLHLGATLASPERSASLRPEVEFLPADEPFRGMPNVIGKAPVSGLASVAAPAMEAGRRYHWQIRAREVGGKAGPWLPFDGTIGYAPYPPPAPTLRALPNEGVVSQKRLQVDWTAAAGPAGLAGFAYSVDQSPTGEPPGQPNTTDPAAAVELAADGEWFFHVRSVDNAGNWSSTSTMAIHLDSRPLAVADAFYRTFAYHPEFDTLRIAFRVSKPAGVTVTILPDRSDGPVRTYRLGAQQDMVRLEWDGKDEDGAVVPQGDYRFRVVATDRAGNVADVIYDKLRVTQKRIIVSLTQQKLWAYDGDQVVLQSFVTTGGPLLPTPEGTFQVLSKQSPFTFHSPWPEGSPYWYPDSPTSFAMMFDTDGYFIHDAPWRHRFGPGSNFIPGQPGEETSGTHGCVNVPLDVQTRLFAWSEPGTPVVIQR